MRPFIETAPNTFHMFNWPSLDMTGTMPLHLFPCIEIDYQGNAVFFTASVDTNLILVKAALDVVMGDIKLGNPIAIGLTQMTDDPQLHLDIRVPEGEMLDWIAAYNARTKHHRDLEGK